MARTASPQDPRWKKALARNRARLRQLKEKSISLSAWKRAAMSSERMPSTIRSISSGRSAATPVIGVSMPSIRSSGGAPAVRSRSLALRSQSTSR